MTQSQLIRLLEAAQSGDKKSQKKLQSYFTPIAKRVNERLRKQAQVGYNTSTSEYAAYFLSLIGRKGFSANAKIIQKDYGREQFLILNKIYNKNETLSSIRKQRKLRIEAFRNVGLDIPQEKEEEFFAFLRSDFFREFEKFDSERIINTIYEALSEPGSYNKFNEIYTKYQQGKISLLEGVEEFEGWTKLQQ